MENLMDHFDSFSFQWPWMLLFLVLVPIFFIWYRNSQKQKLEQAMRFSYTALVEKLQHRPGGWRRLLFPVLMMTMMTFLILAMARPTVTLLIPTQRVNMMLILDISLSMMATDLKPDRITAAKDAAIEFVKSLPNDVRIGLELFAGDSWVLSRPTSKHKEVIDFLENLSKDHLQTHTQIGNALRTALNILDMESEITQTDTEAPPPEQVIILMSDGDSHEGYPWDLAARQAKQSNITIHTVGIGSKSMVYIPFQGQMLPANFNEQTLRQIATITGGQYHRAFTEADFKRIYEEVRDRSVHFEEKTEELGYLLTMMAFICFLLALGLSDRWGPLGL